MQFIKVADLAPQRYIIKKHSIPKKCSQLFENEMKYQTK